MTTEAAFIVNLQHEYLRDARVRIAACLQALPDVGSDVDGVLRLHWQTTHGLKGEAAVVGFPHLARYLEEVENGLGAVERALGGPVGDATPRAHRTSPGPHASVRLASALREATYGLEDYLRALEREYTDDESLFERVRDATTALSTWNADDDADWGMGAPDVPDAPDAPAPAPEPDIDAGPGGGASEIPSADAGAHKGTERDRRGHEAASKARVDTPSIGEGIVFDPEVFAKHVGGPTHTPAPAPATAPALAPTPAWTPVVSSPVLAPTEVTKRTPSRNDAERSGDPNPAAATPANPAPATSTPATTHTAGASAFAPPPASAHGTDASSAPGQAEHDLYLVMIQDGLSYALPLGQVVEIVEARAWNPLPLPKRNILGVINLRGTVLPVCDFQGVVGRVAFAVPGTRDAAGGASGEPASSPRCIVVVSVGGRRFGVPVRGVSHVAEIPGPALTALEASGLRAGEGVVTHTALVEGRTTMIIDMARMAA